MEKKNNDAVRYTRGNTLLNDEKVLHGSCKTGSCNRLNVFDWLGDLPDEAHTTDLVEVRFKNIRKGYYRNDSNLKLRVGEIVAVEATPGHDIGIVSLTGTLVLEQMKKNEVDRNSSDIKKIYRIAKLNDIDKWKEAIAREIPTMLKAREIAEKLKLNMKIGDVEYQGDKTRAIFYYIADERVDFRELIKVLAEEFRVRIEMKQIGVRQEAGRIGGIGSCGRELCCASWITNFVSVATSAARFQQLSPNPQKLTGQCSKLKCCLNYEFNCYYEAQQDFPDTGIPLESTQGRMFHQKTDVFKGMMWYSFAENSALNLIAIPVARVKEIILQNKKGEKPEVVAEEKKPAAHTLDFENVVGQESITRFDKERRRPQQRRKNKRR